MKLIRIFTAVIMVVALGVLPAAESLSPEEIAERSFNAGKLAGSEAISILTIVNKNGHERVRKIAMVTKLCDNGRTEKKLFRFLEPADLKGTGFLTYDYEDKDDDMWIFMPALRKTRRIVSSEKAKSFMGSEFSYADMAPPVLSDFKFAVTGEEEVDGTLCWKVEMVPKSKDVADENGFSRRVTLVAKKDFVSRRAVYYDRNGRLEKELTVKDIREVDPENHKFRPMYMEMENKSNGRRSVIKIDKLVFNAGVKDDYFTVRYLERF